MNELLGFTRWFQRFGFNRPKKKSTKRRSARRRLSFDCLEQRQLLAVIPVLGTAADDTIAIVWNSTNNVYDVTVNGGAPIVYAAGDTLVIDGLAHTTGDTVQITGSPGNDSIGITAGVTPIPVSISTPVTGNPAFTVNLTLNNIENFNVDASGGSDELNFTGSAVNNAVVINATTDTNGAATGYSIVPALTGVNSNLTGFETLNYDGAAPTTFPGDTLTYNGNADLLDSVTFVSSSTAGNSSVRMATGGFNLAANLTSVETITLNAGTTTNGSRVLDKIVAVTRPGTAQTVNLRGPNDATGTTITGGGGPNVTAVGFENQYLYGDEFDTANMNDVPNRATVLYARATHEILVDVAGSFYNQAVGFGAYGAMTATGNNDAFRVYGDAGNQNVTVNSPTGTTMIVQNVGFKSGFVGDVTLAGNSFRYVYLYGRGGTDTATFDATSSTATNPFTFVALPTYSTIYNRNYYQYLDRFQVYVTGNNTATAVMYDSTGNDTFTMTVGTTTTAVFAGANFRNTAEDFARVYAYQYFGGSDIATIGDNTVGAGNLTGDANSVVVQGIGSATYVQAYYFNRNIITGSGGTANRAQLFDGVNNDTLAAQPIIPSFALSATMLYGGGRRVETYNYGVVYAYGTAGGLNYRNVSGNWTSGRLIFVGSWI